jgi:hypothetical protein
MAAAAQSEASSQPAEGPAPMKLRPFRPGPEESCPLCANKKENNMWASTEFLSKVVLVGQHFDPAELCAPCQHLWFDGIATAHGAILALLKKTVDECNAMPEGATGKDTGKNLSSFRTSVINAEHAAIELYPFMEIELDNGCVEVWADIIKRRRKAEYLRADHTLRIQGAAATAAVAQEADILQRGKEAEEEARMTPPTD